MNCTSLGYYTVCSGNSLPMLPIVPTFEGQVGLSKKESRNKDVVGISQILLYASFGMN
jgi:hypothetical protein